MYSFEFEVHIGLLPLFLTVKKISPLLKFGADLFRWSQETEQNMCFPISLLCTLYYLFILSLTDFLSAVP